MQTIKIRVASIRIDGGTQNRVTINQDTVAEYAESMTEGAIFPPVILFHDGVDYWLVDGFHRYHATKSIDALDIDAIVTNGTQREAILYSTGVNGAHGLPRTNADKRKAVMVYFNDAEWIKLSDREIAKRCAVSHNFVSEIRRALSSDYTKTDETKKEKVSSDYTQGEKQNDLENASRLDTEGKGSRETKENKGDRSKDGGQEEYAQGNRDDGVDEAIGDEKEQIIKEQSDVIEDLIKENDKLKAAVANQQVPEGLEVQDVDSLIDEKNARIKQLEIELKAVTTSRDSLMREVNELKVQIKKYQAVLRKQGEKDVAIS